MRMWSRSRPAPARIRFAAAGAALLLGALWLAPLSASAEEGAAGDAPPLSPQQEEMAAKIFRELVAPCCWTTTVDVHGSGAAPRIQAEVRQMISRGMSHREIIDHYVEEYGERILAKPKRTGFNLAAYWAPYLALLAGAVLVAAFVRRGARRRAPVPARRPAGREPIPGSDEDYRRRIEEELRRSS